MSLDGLEKEQDFQYLDRRLLVSCPAGSPDEAELFSLGFKHNALEKLFTDIEPAIEIVVRDLYMPHTVMVHKDHNPEFRISRFVSLPAQEVSLGGR